MLKRIINVLLVSALLVATLAASVALAEPEPSCTDNTLHRGVPCATDDNLSPPGAPLEGENRDGWGAVTSQRATTDGDIGEHASDPTPGDDQPRDGVGNVSGNDSGLLEFAVFDPEGDETDLGRGPFAHSCVVDDITQTDCTADPGLAQ